MLKLTIKLKLISSYR